MTCTRTVYIVDDDAIVRRSCATLVQNAGHAPHPFASGEDFVEALDYLDDGCVLLDVHMPGLSGLDVQDRLTDRGSDMPVIIMTGESDIPTAVRAIKQGAMHFIEKPFADDHLLETITAAFEQLDLRLAHGTRRREAMHKIDTLTRREQEVMNGVASGRANKVIAREIGISVRTVEMHRGNIMRKLGIHSTGEVLKIILDAGMGLDALPRRPIG